MLPRTIRTFIVLAVLVGAVLAISVPAAAQITSNLCTEIGRLTGNRILVDVEGSAVAGAGAIQCSVLADWVETNRVLYTPGAIGTPRIGFRVEVPAEQYVFSYLASVDVYVQASPAGGRPRSAFGWFQPEPVRVCFKQQDPSLRIGSLDNSKTELNDLFVVFSDARTFQDARRPARDLRPLNIVPEGLPLGYVCADIDTPGTVSLVQKLGTGINNTNVFEPVQPNRCTFAGQPGCIG